MTEPLLPVDAKSRKAAPMARGFLDYFPLAIAAVASCSRIASEQHNPGEPMRWAKEKSTDHADCILRHLAERGTIDADGIPHSAKVAWRAMALLQIELENAAKGSSSWSTCAAVCPSAYACIKAGNCLHRP